ncbi:MAG: hypothetical protein P4M11_02955 [Candidatus Pacebacteria bacterium]|nr:hypothetical protein [Candidatus Paceibacterota bacterium]
MTQEEDEPGVVMRRTAYHEFLDFDFLNQGTVFCAVGLKPTPRLTVFDLLLPPAKCAVIQEAVGGNIVLGMRENKQILVFNSRQRGMSLFDLRVRRFFTQFVPPHGYLRSSDPNR